MQGTNRSRACAKITVRPAYTVPGGCSGTTKADDYERYMRSIIGFFNGGSEAYAYSSVESRVRNVERDGTRWQDDVTYAKPGDTIYWINCYYPAAQGLASADRTKTVDHGGVDGHDHPTDLWEPASTSIPNDNEALQTTFGWKNDFKVDSEANKITNPSNNVFQKPTEVITNEPWENIVTRQELLTSKWYRFNVDMQNGNYSVKKTENDYEVKIRDDAGSTYIETITTKTDTPDYAYIDIEERANSYTWVCGQEEGSYDCCDDDGNNCYCGDEDVYCTHSNHYTTGGSTDSELSDDSKVIIPYNFQN